MLGFNKTLSALLGALHLACVGGYLFHMEAGEMWELSLDNNSNTNTPLLHWLIVKRKTAIITKTKHSFEQQKRFRIYGPDSLIHW